MPLFGATTFPRVIISDGAGHYLQLPSLTTTQRDALTAVNGMTIYNSTTNQVEEYNNGAWGASGAPALTTHTADLDAHTKNWGEKVKTGRYMCPFPCQPGATTALTADRLYASPIPIPRAMTADRIAIEITSAASSGKKGRLGIYNGGTNIVPGTLLLDAGEIAIDSTGLIAATIDQALTKELYWFAFVVDEACTIYTASYTIWSPIGTRATGFARWIGGVFGSHTYGALPDPFPTSLTEQDQVFCILPRIASLD